MLFLQPQAHISENCSPNDLNYTVTLLNSKRDKVGQDSMVCVQGMEGRCSISLSFVDFEMNETYCASVEVSNGIGESNNSSTSQLIGKHSTSYTAIKLQIVPLTQLVHF